MYLEDHVGQEQLILPKDEVTQHSDSARKVMLKELLSLANKYVEKEKSVYMFSEGFPTSLTDLLESELATFLDAEPSNQHINCQLLERDDFKEIAAMSMNTTLQHWFTSLFSLSLSECLAFDKDIQKLNEFIFQTYCQEMRATRPNSKKKATHFYGVIYNKITAVRAEANCLSVKQLQNQKAIVHLVLTLARWFWERLQAFSKYKKQALAHEIQEQKIDLKREVNRIVGWGIAELSKQFTSKMVKDNAAGNDDSVWDEHCLLLEQMKDFSQRSNDEC